MVAGLHMVDRASVSSTPRKLQGAAATKMGSDESIDIGVLREALRSLTMNVIVVSSHLGVQSTRIHFGLALIMLF